MKKKNQKMVGKWWENYSENEEKNPEKMVGKCHNEGMENKEK